MCILFVYDIEERLYDREKNKKDIKVDERVEPLQDYFKVVLSVYGSEIVVNLKPFDWEYYGESLDSTLDEVIKDLEEAIQEKDEEEREAKEEMEQRERDYWEVQGAKRGFVKCF